METSEFLAREISAFIDRYKPATERERLRLQEIRNELIAGSTLESQYQNFIAIADADLLRAFYKAAPDFREKVLAHPRCPKDIELSAPVTATEEEAPAPVDSAQAPKIQAEKPRPVPVRNGSRHPLLVLSDEIDLDLKGLADYEASLPAGKIIGPGITGCQSRMANLQRLFDRVPAVLHETDLTDNENPLFYELLSAKQRLSSNLKLYTRLCISMNNRFEKPEADKAVDDENDSLIDGKQEEPQEDLQSETEGLTDPDIPTEEELEEAALAALLAEEAAKAEEAKQAEKKAANQKRQQRLRKEAKEREERSLEEQRRREEAAREYERQHQAQYNQQPQDSGQQWDQIRSSDRAEYERKQNQYREDDRLREQDEQARATREQRETAVRDYRERMDRSYEYESFGKSHIDFSGKEHHGDVSFQPYVYTPNGGVAASSFQSGANYAQMSNSEIYRAARESGTVTPEMSSAMKDNLAALRTECEAAKGTDSYDEVTRRYQDARDAVMAITNDIRNDQLSVERRSTPAEDYSQVNRLRHADKDNSFTAYQYTPAGVYGTAYNQGAASGGVIVHNAPGTVGKDILSPEKPLLVTKTYEDSLYRDAEIARNQLHMFENRNGSPGSQRPISSAEYAAYQTSLAAYDGFRRAKADGLVKVTSEPGAINTPDQRAWAARQETYLQTLERNRAKENTRTSGHRTSDHSNTQIPKPRDVKPQKETRSQNTNDSAGNSRPVPFGNFFSLNYHRGKYTSGEKESSSDILNKSTKLRSSGLLRTTGSKLAGVYSDYAPYAASQSLRKFYNLFQSGDDISSQSVRGFDQGRYYCAVATGAVLAFATRNVGDLKSFDRHAAKVERSTFDSTRELSAKTIARNQHTSINEGRASKKEIRQFYEKEAGLDAQGRRDLAAKLKEHSKISKETTKWSSLKELRTREAAQREVLVELHRRSSYGYVTENSLKELQKQRQQIHVERRNILNSQPERAALNKRISDLQKAGRENLSPSELAELKELRSRLGKLSSDPRLKALDKQEQDLLKQMKEKPIETKAKKKIKLDDARKLRKDLEREFNAREIDEFRAFVGIQTNAIKKNKQLLERQSEIAKRKIAALKAKGGLSVSERAELRKLESFLKSNKAKIKAHADVLKFRNMRDIKLGEIDKIIRQLQRNKHRKYMTKMALVNFMLRPLQEGDNIGAQGIAKLISVGANPYVRGLVRTSVNMGLRFSGFVAKKVGSVTGLDVVLTPAINKVKDAAVVVRKAANTPGELKRKLIKTASNATKHAVSNMTPQFVKTGASAARASLAKLSARFKVSRIGKAISAASRTLAKAKAAIGALAKAAAALAGKVALIILCCILVFGVISVVISGIAGVLPSFLIMGTDADEDSGKINLSPYANIFNEELLDFKASIEATAQAKDYEKVDYVHYGPESYNNTKEIFSMMAVRMNQDLDMEKNKEVEPYIRHLFDISHSFYAQESEPFSCSGCKTRTVEVDHSDTCETDEEGNIICEEKHTKEEIYCPGTHVNLTITVTTLGFDDLFTADTMGNEGQTAVAGDLIGNFTITYYCTEKYPHICNDGTADTTATGTTPTPGRTIAVDPSVIPLNSAVVIDGHTYIAEDTGGAIGGNRIDIVVKTHNEALQKGTREGVPVYRAAYEGEGIQETGKWEGWNETNITWAKTIYGTDWSELYSGVYNAGSGIIFDVNDVVTSVHDTWGTMTFVCTSGTLTSKFGYRDIGDGTEFHKGIDIGVVEGTPVHVIADGKVVSAINSSSGGLMITVDHGNGLVSRYLHNSILLVKAGDEVKSGDVVALSGNTGRSTGPHIHMDCTLDGKYFDPLSLFETIPLN